MTDTPTSRCTGVPSGRDAIAHEEYCPMHGCPHSDAARCDCPTKMGAVRASGGGARGGTGASIYFGDSSGQLKHADPCTCTINSITGAVVDYDCGDTLMHQADAASLDIAVAGPRLTYAPPRPEKNVSVRVGDDPRPCTCTPGGMTWEPDCPRHAEMFDTEMSRPPVVGDPVHDLVEAIRLTWEYVGHKTLPPEPGWSFYDALRKHAPAMADHMVAEAVRLDALARLGAAGDEDNLARCRRCGALSMHSFICPIRAERGDRYVIPEDCVPDETVTTYAEVASTGDHARDILETAAGLVNGDRNTDYGDALDNFTETAALWSPILGVQVTAEQVALCMNQLKVARLIHNTGHADSWVDAAGYIGLGGGIAHRRGTD